jgi:hypothetical protein
LVYFTAIGMLTDWQFGIFFPVLVNCIEKNLAALLSGYLCYFPPPKRLRKVSRTDHRLSFSWSVFLPSAKLEPINNNLTGNRLTFLDSAGNRINGRERVRERETETERQTDRQTDRQTEIERNRKKEIEKLDVGNTIQPKFIFRLSLISTV